MSRISAYRGRWRALAASVFACTSALAACSSTSTVIACGVAGRERRCPCSSANAVGIQSCELEGSWGACTCYPLASGRSATGQVTGAGTSGTAAGSGGTAGTDATRDAPAAAAHGSTPTLMAYGAGAAGSEH